MIPLLQLLIVFGAFQALFVALILLRKAPSKLYYRLFALFLIIEGITLVERLLAETGNIDWVPHLVGISHPINFIKPPILLAIAYAMMDPGFRLKKMHIWHALPFFFMLVMNIPFYFQSAAAKVEMATSFIHYVPSYQSFDFYWFCTFYLYIAVYLYLALRKLFQDEHQPGKIARAYGNVLKIYSGALLIFFIYFILSPAQIFTIASFNTISMVVMTLIIQSVAYKLLSSSRTISTGSQGYDPQQIARDCMSLKQKMEEDQLFLNDGLSLTLFAQQVDLPKAYVSHVINQGFGLTFKEWINNYRVGAAVKMMKKNGQLALIDIATICGFNNKVSFYRSFKKVTGKSPSDYYKSL